MRINRGNADDVLVVVNQKLNACWVPFLWVAQKIIESGFESIGGDIKVSEIDLVVHLGMTFRMFV